MDAITIINTIAKIIKVAVDLTPTVIKTVEDAKPFAEALYKALRGNGITQDDLYTLEIKIDELSKQLQLPLPPEEER